MEYSRVVHLHILLHFDNLDEKLIIAFIGQLLRHILIIFHGSAPLLIIALASRLLLHCSAYFNI